MTYIKPQVLIHQEFVQQTASNESTLRAMIIGPNAILHRYTDSDEKQEIALGEYNQGSDTSYLYPNRSAGGVVDNDYSKLYADNAMLSYYEDLSQTAAEGNADITVYSLSSAPNIIRTAGVNLVYNGEAYPRAAALGSRDVQIGDYVWLHSYEGTGATPGSACEHTYFTSKIVGFAPTLTQPAPRPETEVDVTLLGITDSVAAAPLTVAPSGVGTPTLSVAGAYNGLASGSLNVSYSVSVKQIISTADCTSSVWLQIESEDTGEDYLIEIFHDEEFNIGAYGIKGEFEETAFNSLTADSRWVVSTAIDYDLPTLTIGGTYTGAINDRYTVEIVSGGIIADSVNCPIAIIRNASNTEVIKGIRIRDTAAHTYGSNGLTFAFTGTDALAKGQRFTFLVTASVNGDIQALILQDDVPPDMQSVSSENKTALDIRLMARQASIIIPEENTITPESANFTQADTQFTVSGTILLAADGFAAPVKLVSGDLFLEYREWSPIVANAVNYCSSVSDLDLIPGQLSPDNPLKYGVYKAISVSNGVSVAYSAVTDPDDLSAWQDAVAVAEGTSDIYKLVPMSTDIRVANMVQAVVNAESGYASCRWKTAAYAFELPVKRMVVGKNTINNTLMETSTNGLGVFAEFIQNQNETDTPYNKLHLTSGNANFVNYGVKPGDTVKIVGAGYSTDFTVDTVISSGTLVLTTAGAALAGAPIEIEIWHDMTKAEQAAYYGQLAGAMTSRRNIVVYPTVVGENGVELPGYYIAAAIAGLSSGINAFQSMTRSELTGFDDYSRVKPYFTEAQLDTLAAAGVFIVMEDSSKTPFVRHAVTTDMSSTAKQEEAITRDYDYICKTLYSVLDSYVGKSNITTKFLARLRLELIYALDDLIASGHVNSYADLAVTADDLLADRVNVSATIRLPFPVNNIEMFLYADKGL